MWTFGRTGDALRFWSGSSLVTATGGQVVITANTYAVAAWAKLDATDGEWRVAVSQDGAQSSGFVLEYRPDTKRWAFLISLGDA